MLDTLGMPLYRRIVGASFIVVGYLMGASLVVAPQLFPNGLLGFDTVDVGTYYVAAAIVCTPSVLYPCVYDRFPNWISRKFPLLELMLRHMLCPPKKS